MTGFQTAADRCPDRKDHVWVGVCKHFKCVLCGAITLRKPPPYPTPEDWLPDTYETLTLDERALCPEKRA